MQFRVPQFIDIEDKLFGPLTLKQFIYLAGGAGISFILLKLLPLYIAIFLVAPVGIFAVALAFYKVNDKPFINIVEAYLKYQVGGKLYLWKQRPPEPKIETPESVFKNEATLPKLSSSKLKELSWSLDVLDNKKQAEEAQDIDSIVEKGVKSKYDLKI